jgi:hypothetical protein
MVNDIVPPELWALLFAYIQLGVLLSAICGAIAIVASVLMALWRTRDG